MPEWSNGAGLGPVGLCLRGFESFLPHKLKMAEEKQDLEVSEEDEEKVKERLRDLGYLD